MAGQEKQVTFIASAQDDLRDFPEEVRQVMGFALFEAQKGAKHPAAKVLKGFGGAGVLEVVDDYDGDTYRTVYTVRFSDAIYVLHAFQKKSKKGAKTPKQDIEIVKSRLKTAERLHAERQSKREG